ncbi:3-phosphoserine/phosphohydroxythreonine transaminase [Thauera sp.]|uniref:3-phosphoserine/phosphohydroxythreonine transaminase n=1 Tax=Thauera sp. TaxID=1905334 RepID=UPI002584A22C|nr:3-phosphoserine/phosphohydroxythreonine transaminase [Thauera sp.]
MESRSSPDPQLSTSASGRVPTGLAAWRTRPGFSFSAAAGPLPTVVADEVAEACRPGPGSILSLPFTTSAYRSLQAETEACLRRLLAIPDEFVVLFMAGGASTQFALVPMNLYGADTGTRAVYIDSGHWSRRAIAEARRHCPVHVCALAALTAAWGCGGVPETAAAQTRVGMSVLEDAVGYRPAYVHVTPNETADGLQFARLPVTQAPLVADLTSELLTRAIDWQRLDVGYAGTQKTIGTPGLTLVIIRRSLLGHARAGTPRVMDYGAQAEAESRLCTPPVLPVFVAHRMLHWIEAAGGVAAMAVRLAHRHALVTAAMAAGEDVGLYRWSAPSAWRSQVNPCFQLPDEETARRFFAAADATDLHDLGGHPERGGVRLSLYNGLADDAVAALAGLLSGFACSEAGRCHQAP